MNPNAALYETDFYSWCLNTAALIRDGKWSDLDRAALAEEIEALAARDQREYAPALQALTHPCIEVAVPTQPTPTGHSWRSTIRNQRDELLGLFRQRVPPWDARPLRPSTKATMAPTWMPRIKNPGCPLATFPVACPWTESPGSRPGLLVPDALATGGDPRGFCSGHIPKGRACLLNCQ